MHLISNRTGETDPDDDGVTTAVEVYFCYDPQNASETPVVNEFSPRIEDRCEDSSRGES